MYSSFLICCAVLLTMVNAHMGAYAPGMYCQGGPSGDNQDSNDVVNPLYQLPKSEWWLHHVDKCDEAPPKNGDILKLPAGGSFTVEVATNQAFTTLSYEGKRVSDWPDGASHPDDFNNGTDCIISPNLHTQNQANAAGTAFAISYQSDIKQVTPENLVVFSIRYHTPWKRLTTYDVPADLPACPEGGCVCAWGWVANGCGQPNMFQHPFRCTVTGATGVQPVAPAQPPVWCEDDPSKCVKGAKQMVYYNQLDGNNIDVEGQQDLSGAPRKPTYNMKLGFVEGAQNDIFVGAAGYT